ncbi:unnamed protein product [marine sediment metagenome]|uniref:Uncharacterized protein n=1 Tax=marine sediment metagenome TaxID=412755 RepID=X1IBT9_9ZZZZ
MVQQKESVLLTKWLAKFHRTSLQWKRVRLGVPANPEEAKYFQVMLRWADAIFIEDGFVHIVEAKLRPDLGTIGQVEGYKELFPVTPEFDQYKDWPIKMIILSPVLDLGVAQICTKKGITYEVWKPEDWE